MFPQHPVGDWRGQSPRLRYNLVGARVCTPPDGDSPFSALIHHRQPNLEGARAWKTRASPFLVRPRLAVQSFRSMRTTAILVAAGSAAAWVLTSSPPRWTASPSSPAPSRLSWPARRSPRSSSSPRQSGWICWMKAFHQARPPHRWRDRPPPLRSQRPRRRFPGCGTHRRPRRRPPPRLAGGHPRHHRRRARTRSRLPRPPCHRNPQALRRFRFHHRRRPPREPLVHGNPADLPCRSHPHRLRAHPGSDIEVTDETSAIEAYGGKVKLVPSTSPNPKITTRVISKIQFSTLNLQIRVRTPTKRLFLEG